jgi:hypothetical protein
LLPKKPAYQRFIARQQLRKYATVLEPLLCNNGSTVGSVVFYVVCSEAILLHRQSYSEFRLSVHLIFSFGVIGVPSAVGYLEFG